MIDGHILKEWRAHIDRNLRELTRTVVFRAVKVIDHQVMNAVALALERGAVI